MVVINNRIWHGTAKRGRETTLSGVTTWRKTERAVTTALALGVWSNESRESQKPNSEMGNSLKWLNLFSERPVRGCTQRWPGVQGTDSNPARGYSYLSHLL